MVYGAGCEKNCQHGGELRVDKCACECFGHWTGEFCSQCPLVCQNGGINDYEKCECKCPPPFTGAMCNLVGCSLQCMNGGKLAKDGSCKCECPPGTKGPLCGQREDWCYNDDSCGPDNWGGLSPDFSMCAKGAQQSPINIQQDAVVRTPDMPEVRFMYKAGKGRLVNTGMAAQIEFSGAGVVQYGKVNYNILQVHFHRPGEHLIDGKAADMEMHFVNQAADNSFLIVSLLFSKSDHDNIILNRFWNDIPSKKSEEFELPKLLNPVNFMSETETRDFYEYTGSLTTPPCVEGVKNLVLLKPAEISNAQLKHLESIFPSKNNRPAQAMTRTRTVYKYQGANELFNWGYTNQDSGVSGNNDTYVFPGYSCQNGMHQSPINLDGKGARGLVYHHPDVLALITRYIPMKPAMSPATFLQLVVDKKSNHLLFMGEKFNLESIRFHSPALHSIKRRISEMEIVFVHTNDEGALHLSVMVEKGDTPHLSAAIAMGKADEIPRKDPKVPHPKEINPTDFLPENPNFYSYDGSEVINPCEEGVKWVVMKDPIYFTPDQIWQYFQQIPQGVRVRPIQPTNKRLIMSTTFPQYPVVRKEDLITKGLTGGWEMPPKLTPEMEAFQKNAAANLAATKKEAAALKKAKDEAEDAK